MILKLAVLYGGGFGLPFFMEEEDMITRYVIKKAVRDEKTVFIIYDRKEQRSGLSYYTTQKAAEKMVTRKNEKRLDSHPI